MNFYVWTKKKAPNLYQLGANDNEKETLIDCTSASAVFFYQIKSFVSILEDESARFFAVSKSNSNADRNRGKTGVFLGEFIVDKPVAINNIVEEIRKFAINKRNWTIKNNVLCCLRRECLLPYFWPDARKRSNGLLCISCRHDGAYRCADCFVLLYHDAGQPHSGYGPRGQLCGLSARRNPAHHQTGRCRSAAGRHDWGCCLLCRFRCAIEQIAVSANENLSVNNDISVSLSITFYEKQIEK